MKPARLLSGQKNGAGSASSERFLQLGENDGEKPCLLSEKRTQHLVQHNIQQQAPYGTFTSSILSALEREEPLAILSQLSTVQLQARYLSRGIRSNTFKNGACFITSPENENGESSRKPKRPAATKTYT